MSRAFLLDAYKMMMADDEIRPKLAEMLEGQLSLEQFKQFLFDVAARRQNSQD